MKAGIFDNQEKINLVIEKDHSNIFVFISEKHVFLLNLMQAINNSVPPGKEYWIFTTAVTPSQL